MFPSLNALLFVAHLYTLVTCASLQKILLRSPNWLITSEVSLPPLSVPEWFSYCEEFLSWNLLIGLSTVAVYTLTASQ
jgi:hypothetical protein